MTAVAGLHTPLGLGSSHFHDMAGYNHHHSPEPTDNYSDYHPARPALTHHDSQPALAPSDLLAQTQHSGSQSYAYPSYYGPPQVGGSYGYNDHYAPGPHAFPTYPPGTSASNPDYTSYYPQQINSFTSMPSGQLPFPPFDPSVHASTSPQAPQQPRHLAPADSPQMVRAGSRSQSLASSTVSSVYRSGPSKSYSRSASPSGPEMSDYGYRNERGTWSCSSPNCTSRSTFQRGCDLRKHYRRHSKSLFCRTPGCPQATESGFSSKKDRARHEAKHDPQITCEWPGCDRLFSRTDNMKDHVRRIHKRDTLRPPGHS